MFTKALATLVVFSSIALADDAPLPRVTTIYPFVPYSTQEVKKRVADMTEEGRPLMNVFEMDRRGLVEGAAAIQPWAGFFWSLNQGQVANVWQDKSYWSVWKVWELDKFWSWEANIDKWKSRSAKLLPKGIDMDQDDLNKLAPSEKYDLLTGNKDFDLTHRVWDFIETWGSQKYQGYMTSIDMPEGYRLPEVSRKLSLWEGICHGWAVAAGGYPRPENIVNVKLPNGKNLPFYPHDLKALASLMFANSMVQSNTRMEGLRCNEAKPKQDEFGRYIDEPRKAGETTAACADVHPGVFHATVVNLMGIQKRSFVADVDHHSTVNNHPQTSYKFNWFNPMTGKKGDVYQSVIDLATYDDPYKSARNPDAVKLVGVKFEMRYIDWKTPNKDKNDSPGDDKTKKKEFRYDLELDKDGNIVGGQWRADEKIKRYADGEAPEITMPDFIWALPKNHMDYFPTMNLEKWDGQGFVPASWIQPAINAHSFVYQETREFGFNEQCSVLKDVDEVQPNGKIVKKTIVKLVNCEFKYPRPQPLTNIVHKLFEMSQTPQQ